MSIPVDNHIFLTGRPPVGEFLGFIRGMALNGQDANLGALTAEWREANDHVRALEETESTLADNPPLSPVPSEIESIVAHVLADPMCQRAHSFVPSEILMVELDRLIVFQKFINLEFVGELKKSISAHASLVEVARLAFGIQRPQPPFQMMQNSPNTFSFVCSSKDFRFIEPIVLPPDQMSVLQSSGQPLAVIALLVGFGSNYLSAISIDGRLVLSNGSHRAYALRDLGFTHAPCLVQRASRRDELELIATPDLIQSPDRYLKDKRPPLLKDYFDKKLTKIVPVPRKNRLIRVQFGFEQSEIPAA